MQKISPLPGFDPWTVQPIGSRYNDYATRSIVPSMLGHNIIPYCLYSITDFMMMDLHGSKHVEELYNITVITVHLVGFNSNSCLTMHDTNDVKCAESSINHGFYLFVMMLFTYHFND